MKIESVTYTDNTSLIAEVMADGFLHKDVPLDRHAEVPIAARKWLAAGNKPIAARVDQRGWQRCLPHMASP